MNLQEYYVQTGTNPFIWAKTDTPIRVSIPVKDSREVIRLSLSGTHRPFLVTGECNKFKGFLELMLARDYHYTNFHITTITADSKAFSTDNLMMSVLPNVQDFTVHNNSLEELGSYLSIVKDNLLTMSRIKEAVDTPHLIYIFRGILSNILASVDRDNPSSISIQEKLNEILSYVSAGGRVSVFFMEEEITADLLEEFCGFNVPLCFKSSPETSKEVLGTDIACILSGDNTLYTLRNGVIISCEIPEIEEKEVQSLISNILTSR